MNNTTGAQESIKPLDNPGFMAYCTLMAVIILVAGAVMGITVVALALAKSIPRTLCLFLINLLLAGLVMGLGVVFIVSTSATLVVLGSEHPRPPQYLCRVYLWTYAVGAVARLWNLAAFSLSVLAIVRFGKKTISLHCAAVILTILWLAPIAICLYVLLPFVFEAQLVQSVACFPDDENIMIIHAYHIFFANWVTSGGLIPLVVSIAVPIVCLCYIEKNNSLKTLCTVKGWPSSPFPCAGWSHQYCRSNPPRCNIILCRNPWIISRLRHCCSLPSSNSHYHHRIPETGSRANQENVHLL